MTKPLSEQVAELQELFDRVALECDQRGGTIAELQDEREYYRHRATAADEKVIILGAANKRLVADNTTLEAERDRLKADAISDLIERQWLEVAVRNRESEREALRQYLKEAQAERDDLQRQVQEARDEGATLPRVIGADELREGQTVAIWCIESGTTDLMAMLGVVERTNGRDVTLRSDCAGAPNWLDVAAGGINTVLLEDAPEPKTTTTRLTDPDGTMWEVNVHTVNDATLTTPEQA